jgi:hypothetical protein
LNVRGCVDSVARLPPPLDVPVTLFFTNLLLFTFFSSILTLLRQLLLLEVLLIATLFREDFCFFFPMLSRFFLLFTALDYVWLWPPGQSSLDDNTVGSTSL